MGFPLIIIGLSRQLPAQAILLCIDLKVDYNANEAVDQFLNLCNGPSFLSVGYSRLVNHRL